MPATPTSAAMSSASGSSSSVGNSTISLHELDRMLKEQQKIIEDLKSSMQ